MITLREMDDCDPALAFSPLVRGVEKTFAWIGEHGGIPLTPSKAFKRVFVHWAAAEFDWPGHTEADLFAVNKVLNEPDFAPLMVLHDLMIAMKLGRHYKGEFRLTKAGQALAGHPGRVFGTVVPFFLFRINHASMSRFDDALNRSRNSRASRFRRSTGSFSIAAKRALTAASIASAFRACSAATLSASSFALWIRADRSRAAASSKAGRSI